MHVACPHCGKTVQPIGDGRFMRHRSKPGEFCPLGQSKVEAAGSQGKKPRRKKGKRAPRICPAHATTLVGASTQYGRRYSCPHPSCTVVQWAGSTSTPADAATRAARIKAHDAFDSLWHPERPGSRSKAYAAMAVALELPPPKCHIGMFDIEQCERVIEFAESYCAELVQ
jgi:hypothetical protein